ncbi:hypothetical protein X975_08237, partial [Stegodyphus mimosarum]
MKTNRLKSSSCTLTSYFGISFIKTVIFHAVINTKFSYIFSTISTFSLK